MELYHVSCWGTGVHASGHRTSDLYRAMLSAYSSVQRPLWPHHATPTDYICRILLEWSAMGYSLLCA